MPDVKIININVVCHRNPGSVNQMELRYALFQGGTHYIPPNGCNFSDASEICGECINSIYGSLSNNSITDLSSTIDPFIQ